MIVRSPLDSDHEAWLRMRMELWPHCPEPTHREEIRGYAAPQPSRMAAFIAIDSTGAARGFAEAALRDVAEGCASRPVGYLEGIHVSPDFRALGIGRLLVEAAERWAASLGCTEMASDCLHDNEDSIRFHQAIGFVVTGQLVHFRRALGPQAQ